MSVQEIYDEAVRRLGGHIEPLHYGPAHVVWDDCNYDFAESCIENFNRDTFGLTEEQLQVVMWALVELAKIPIDERFEDDERGTDSGRGHPFA